MTGSAHTTLAGAARVQAALRRAGLTDRIAERPAGTRLAAQALAAIAGIRADPGDTGLARGAEARAGSIGAAGQALGVVACALADAGHAGLALGRVAGTAGPIHASLAGAAAGLASPADAVLTRSASAPTRSARADLAGAGVAIDHVVVDDAVAIIIDSVAHLGRFGCERAADLVEDGALGRQVDPDLAIGHAKRRVGATDGAWVR